MVSLSSGEPYEGLIDADRLWILQWFHRSVDRGAEVNKAGFASAPMDLPFHKLADYIPRCLRGFGSDELYNCQTFAARFHRDPKGLRQQLEQLEQSAPRPGA